MKKFFKRVLIALPILYLILLIPDCNSFVPAAAGKQLFTWRQDSLWMMLEKNFEDSRNTPQHLLDSMIQHRQQDAEDQLKKLSNAVFLPGDPRLSALVTNYFSIAPLIAAQQHKNEWFISYYDRVRCLIKTRSVEWNTDDALTKNELYRALYGMRAAVEEILLQSKRGQFQAVMKVQNEPSSTPQTKIMGIEVHSGDIFVSRGGAEVSAFISRGNDYPGNFSHVALLYVDEKTGLPSFIEAHIERGVVRTTVEEYLKDKKMRFMILRPRIEEVRIKADPLLPHKAASILFNAAGSRHIPYDFKMNFQDTTAMFCSEVASNAYAHYQFELWRSRSTISAPGFVRWLHTFGVENFITEMPSDLEYDQRLAIVAEWRDPELIEKDHIDNAVMDAMLENANKGETIDYSIWMLPIARVLKAYSFLQNVFGKEGIIPEGMSATQGLKNNSFVAMHVAAKYKTMIAVEKFKKEKGYFPPYWELLKMAEKATK